MKSFAYFRWLARRPRVLLFSETGSAAEYCYQALDPAPVTCFLQYSWWQAAEGVVALQRDWLKARPQDQLIIMLNDTPTSEKLLRQGLSSIVVSTSAFLDFDVPRPLETPKLYDAIYVARMSPAKRHELAADIPNTLFVGTVSEWDPPNYDEHVRSCCPHATLSGSIRPTGVPEKICASYAGLILSREEGASRVAAEYQLCGIPVVTTPERGGRTEYLAPAYMTQVAADPAAIAEAVAYWRRMPPDPWYVRTAVLRNLRLHRWRFILAAQQVFDAANAGIDFPTYAHRLCLFSRQHWAARDSRQIETYLADDLQPVT